MSIKKVFSGLLVLTGLFSALPAMADDEANLAADGFTCRSFCGFTGRRYTDDPSAIAFMMKRMNATGVNENAAFDKLIEQCEAYHQEIDKVDVSQPKNQTVERIACMYRRNCKEDLYYVQSWLELVIDFSWDSNGQAQVVRATPKNSCSPN